jgi:lactoylglutathione lyase
MITQRRHRLPRRPTPVVAGGMLLVALLTVPLLALATANSPEPEKNEAMLKGLRTVVYHVPDLDAAKAWFTDAIGIEPYFDQPFYVGFNVGGYELGLLPFEGDTQEPISVTYWAVDEIEAAYKSMLDKGATEMPDGAIKDVGGGEGLVVAHVRNPMGNIVGLIRNPFFKLEEE